MSDDDYTSRLHAFETLLDPSPNGGAEDKVEMNSFGRLCSRGIPPHPPHLRPQSYFLLLSLLPLQKSRWGTEKKKLRKGYYELVRAYCAGLEEGGKDVRSGEVGAKESESERGHGGTGWLQRKETVKEREKNFSPEDKALLAIARDIATLSSESSSSSSSSSGKNAPSSSNTTELAGDFFANSRTPKRMSALNPLGDGQGFRGKEEAKKMVKGKGKARASIGSVLEDADESSETSDDESGQGTGGQHPEGSARATTTEKPSKPNPYGEPISNRRAIFKHVAKLQSELAQAAAAEEAEAATSSSTLNVGRSLRPGLETRETLFDYGRSPSPSVDGREESDDEDQVHIPATGTKTAEASVDNVQEVEVPSSTSENAKLQSPMIILSPSQDGEEPQVDTTQRRKRLPRNTEQPLTPSSDEPVTLLSSQTLPSRSPHELDQEDLSSPDTYAESLLRLIYVFTRSHKRWRYSTSVTHVAAVLFRMYSSGGEVNRMVATKLGKDQKDSDSDEDDGEAQSREDRAKPSLNGWQRHAEANTYWALTGIMNELGGVIAGSAVEGLGQDEAMIEVGDGLRKLRSRVRWADDMLWRGMTLRGLDPGSSMFSYRWITSIFAADLPIQQLLPVWDFILSEGDADAKLDAIVDISTALLYLVKKDLLKRSIAGVHPATAGQKGLTASLWADSAESPLVDYGDQTRLTDEEKEDAFQRGGRLLANYPIQRIGVHEVLKFAWEIKQERIMATLDGEGPDDGPLDQQEVPDEEDLYGYLAPLGGIAQKATESFQQATTYSAPIASSISAGGERLKQYTQNFQDSDAAAMLAKASTNFSVAALSRWATIGKKPSMNSLSSMARQVQASVSAPEIGPPNADTAAGKIWSSLSGTSSPKRASMDQDKFTALPARLTSLSPEIGQQGADLYRRDSSLPPSFISHRGSIVYPAGKYRQRGGGAIGVQSRLQAIASNISKMSPPSSTSERSVPKPLLLGGAGGEGAAQTSPIVRKTGIERSAAKFRNNSKPGIDRSRPSSYASMGSESESGPDGQRYALTDTGAARDMVASPVEVEEDAGHRKKYSLTDAPVMPAHRGVEGADLSRQDSGDSFQSMETSESQQGGLARKKVIRKGRVAARPTNLKLRKSMDSVMSSDGEAAGGLDGQAGGGHSSRRALARVVEATLPSPLLEEEHDTSTPATHPSGIRALPRSPRMVSGPRRPAGVSPKYKQGPSGPISEPMKSMGSDGQAADEEDEVEGDKSIDSTLMAKDGYGDLLESYGSLGEF